MDELRLYSVEDTRKTFHRKTFLIYIVLLSIIIGIAAFTNIRQGYPDQALIQSGIIIALWMIMFWADIKKSFDIPAYIITILLAIMLFINESTFSVSDPGPLIGFAAVPFFVGMITIKKYDHLIINCSIIIAHALLCWLGYINIPLFWLVKLYAVMLIGTGSVWVQRAYFTKQNEALVQAIEKISADTDVLKKAKIVASKVSHDMEKMRNQLHSYFAHTDASKFSDLYKMVAEYTYDWEVLLLPDKSIGWMNKAVERITGMTKDEFLQTYKSIGQAIHPDEQHRFEDRLEKTFRDKISYNDKLFRVKCYGGKYVWVAISWQSSYFENGEFAGVRLSFRLTEERQKIEQLIQSKNQELDKLNKFMIGREKIMIDLKKKVEELESKLEKKQVLE